MIRTYVKWRFSSLVYRKVYFAWKINQIISKNPIISQILGNKINIFTDCQSKNQKQKLFSSCPLWPWIDVIFGNLCPQEALV